MTRRLLILGGTAEARSLARLVAERFGSRVEITVSLAGRTQAPASYAGRMRIGGFGGVGGLAAYLKRERVDLLVDATHPFAATMSAHAVAAAAEARIALLRLQRPAWVRRPGERWIEAADAAAAAREAAGLGARIFLSFGGRELAAFAALRDKWFLVRRIEAPSEALPLRDYVLTLGRGPFTLDDEIELLRRHRIDVLVTKASGGAGLRTKLDAARALDVPVVMIARPGEQPAPTVASPAEAVSRIVALFPDTGIDGTAAVSA